MGSVDNALVASEPFRLSRQVVRHIAPNGGMMTGPGTNGYWIGDSDLVLVDPGPAMPEHLDALEDYAAGRLRAILVTHTHRDHSPAAMPLAKRTGATVYGALPPATPENDAHFKPDRVLQHDQEIAVGDTVLTAIHTPGHASNHFCFLLHGAGMLFTGDHIMNGSTVVIAAPDGNMQQYLNSLVLLKKYPVQVIAPGHGDLLYEPDAVVDWIVAHRLEREAKVMNRLAGLQPCDIDTLLRAVYDEIDPKLLPLAKFSLTAHLEKLVADHKVEFTDGSWRTLG